MIKHRLWATLFLYIVFFAAVASAAYIHSIAPYKNAAPCGRLPGIPGLLQSIHYLAQGNCVLSPAGKTGACKQERSTCLYDDPVSPGNTVKGKCITGPSGHGCFCMASQQ